MMANGYEQWQEFKRIRAAEKNMAESIECGMSRERCDSAYAYLSKDTRDRVWDRAYNDTCL